MLNAGFSRHRRWMVVSLFAAAMAWMEAASVLYLRTLVGRVIPYQAAPLPHHQELSWVELVREIATLIMLAAVGWLAGRNFRTRLAYALIAFGVWDIFYYLFLAVMVGWPRSLLEWDVLFLLPLPWWGPVLAPILISVAMIVGGTLVTQLDRPQATPWPRKWAVALNALGIVLALYVFMADAIRALPRGEQALRSLLPLRFNWPLFLVALLLMSMAIADLTLRRDGWRPARERGEGVVAGQGG
ncbi:MAG TPA: hypothetical protein VK473_04660 [Terriglobales bacterium]|nr:hypothetical protein [Terriglobales bacterium]